MIGLFDSGVGGLTVVAELLKQLPEYDFVYLADTARAPYGSRDPETIEQFVKEDCAFLVAYDADIIVAASNTNTTHRASDIREFIPVPVVGTIAPQFSEVIHSTTKNGKIGILATVATVGNGRYQRLVEEQGFQAFAQACPMLVPLIEAGELEGDNLRSAIAEYVQPLLQQHVDTIILGCTHYPIIREQIANVVGSGIVLIDPAATCVIGLAWYLKTHPELEAQLSKNSQATFYSTSLNDVTNQIAMRLLGRTVTFQHAQIPLWLRGEWNSAILRHVP